MWWSARSKRITFSMAHALAIWEAAGFNVAP